MFIDFFFLFFVVSASFKFFVAFVKNHGAPDAHAGMQACLSGRELYGEKRPNC